MQPQETALDKIIEFLTFVLMIVFLVGFIYYDNKGTAYKKVLDQGVKKGLVEKVDDEYIWVEKRI